MDCVQFETVFDFAISGKSMGSYRKYYLERVRCSPTVDLICRIPVGGQKSIASRCDHRIHAIVNTKQKIYISLDMGSNVSQLMVKSTGYKSYSNSHKTLSREMISCVANSFLYNPTSGPYMFLNDPIATKNLINNGPFVDNRIFLLPKEKFEQRGQTYQRLALINDMLNVTNTLELGYIFTLSDLIWFLSSSSIFGEKAGQNSKLMDFLNRIFWSATKTIITLAESNDASVPDISSKAIPIYAKVIHVFYTKPDGTEGDCRFNGGRLGSMLAYPGFFSDTLPTNYRYDYEKGVYEPCADNIFGKEIQCLDGVHPEYISDISVLSVKANNIRVLGSFVPWDKVTRITHLKKVLYQV